MRKDYKKKYLKYKKKYLTEKIKLFDSNHKEWIESASGGAETADKV